MDIDIHVTPLNTIHKLIFFNESSKNYLLANNTSILEIFLKSLEQNRFLFLNSKFLVIAVLTIYEKIYQMFLLVEKKGNQAVTFF